MKISEKEKPYYYIGGVAAVSLALFLWWKKKQSAEETGTEIDEGVQDAAAVPGPGGLVTDASDMTAYKNGQPVDVTLVPIDDRGHQMESSAADAFSRMSAAAAVDGVTFHVNSAFRTMAEQEALYAERQAHPELGPAAKPGYSNHQSGEAVDIATHADPAVLPWLETNAETFGFKNTVKVEPWHWEHRSAWELLV